MDDLAGIRRGLPWLEPLFADGGYQGERATGADKNARLVLAVVEKPEDTSDFAVLPRCWVVERTFAWLGRNRRLARGHEAGIDSSTGSLHLAAISLLTHRLATT